MNHGENEGKNQIQWNGDDLILQIGCFNLSQNGHCMEIVIFRIHIELNVRLHRFSLQNIKQSLQESDIYQFNIYSLCWNSCGKVGHFVHSWQNCAIFKYFWSKLVLICWLEQIQTYIVCYTFYFRPFFKSRCSLPEWSRKGIKKMSQYVLMVVDK